MNVRSIKLVFFSPTGTTAKIVNGIAQGIHPTIVSSLDLTPPAVRSQEVAQISEELAIIGTPVYFGRVPPEAIHRLQKVTGNNTPAVVVVVYGNREYEDALLELRDVVAELGFKPVAGGVFIGEHSYASEAVPLATGRPDAQDIEKAKQFGESIQKRMREFNTVDDIPPLQVPGKSPYQKAGSLPGLVPVTDESLCTLCAECAEACPTAAITVEDAVVTTQDKCIWCSACVKGCSAGARKWESPLMDQIRKWLKEKCGQRKKPEVFLGEDAGMSTNAAN